MPDGRRVQMSYADAKAQNVPPERLVALNANEAQPASAGHAYNYRVCMLLEGPSG